jgi:hypothetical protein
MFIGLTPKVLTLVPVALISGLYQKPYLERSKIQVNQYDCTLSTITAEHSFRPAAARNQAFQKKAKFQDIESTSLTLLHDCQ